MLNHHRTVHKENVIKELPLPMLVKKREEKSIRLRPLKYKKYQVIPILFKLFQTKRKTFKLYL